MSPGQPFKPPGGLVPAREGGGSLGGEGGEEVARRLPSGVPLLLELLDVSGDFQAIQHDNTSPRRR